jgi:NAD(P)-dependent dehydrogenase (short-subunit alcohol dehydrogenase family)
VAKALVAAGACVAVDYVTAEREAQRVAREIETTGGRAMAVYGDVSKEHQAKPCSAR